MGEATGRPAEAGAPHDEHGRRPLLAAHMAPRPAAVVDLAGATMGSVQLGDVAGGNLTKVGGDLTQASVTLAEGAQVSGNVVAYNLGTLIFGARPEEDERRRLALYLDALARRLSFPPARDGSPQLAGREPPRLFLPLATTARLEVVRGRPAELKAFFQEGDARRPLRAPFSPDEALPDAALFVAERPADDGTISLVRAQTALELVAGERRLVLLGDPGSGKSTVMRYLALAIARRELDPHQAPPLPGWDEAQAPLPILLALRSFAAHLARDDSDAGLYRALRDGLDAYKGKADELLDAGLRGGGLLLLFDGLDELPLADTAELAGRMTALLAVGELAERHPACRVIVTCRGRAFTPALARALGWPVATLAPLTLGQIRHFVAAWYGALAAGGQIEQGLAASLRDALLTTLAARPELASLASTPQLLTMLVAHHSAEGRPRLARARLYEQVIAASLDRRGRRDIWGRRSTPAALTGWDAANLPPFLDQLAYAIHAGAAGPPWWGQIAGGELYGELRRALERAQAPERGVTFERWVSHFDDEGPLLREGTAGVYSFGASALQEYCAGSWLARRGGDPVRQLLDHRAEPRWHQPIILGAGLLGQYELDRLLADLLDGEERRRTKPRAQWYHDLVLAAELGAELGWDVLEANEAINAERHRARLRDGLLALLADEEQPLPIAERVRAALRLGDLGDPRFPVGLAEWRRAIDMAYAGERGGYFCPVAAEAGEVGFWIARFPLTNAQIGLWQRETGQQAGERDPRFAGPNQPATGITWYEARSCCRWLSAQLGATLRLPSEAEWEAAAYGSDGRLYPWGHLRRRDRAAIKDDHNQRAWDAPVPVGCYPAGASPAGALDMLGNVWEWTDEGVAEAQGQPAAGPRPLRGGTYRSRKPDLVRPARTVLEPGTIRPYIGLRIVLARERSAPEG